MYRYFLLFILYYMIQIRHESVLGIRIRIQFINKTSKNLSCPMLLLNPQKSIILFTHIPVFYNWLLLE